MNWKILSLAALIAVGCSGGNDDLWLNCGVPAPEGEPYFAYRILDHWDNLDDSVERGYAGASIWDWTGELPAERIRQYGRLNQSIGINGVVLNNVNANPAILTEESLYRVSNIASILREYGIRTYLSINFASPMTLGECDTADPLDPSVTKWWRDKIDRIYYLIPDFGGFLVKASSEGQPGPQDFGRTHADGANMLGRMLDHYGGIVMWRAFVYSPDSPDRASQAVEEFAPLDGGFYRNVIVQIKNGPVDFQPREPISPLFFNMQKTELMPELQITQEYLGQSMHLAYLGTMWEEFFAAMFGAGQDIPCRKAIAGVANTGQDGSWCGHIFSQANWYAFGRLAWDPTLDSAQIAEEWLRGTFRKPWWCSEKRFTDKFIAPVKDMMMRSREACVDYEMPLGLHHLFDSSHYGPGPWEKASRPDWMPSYYHKAAADGIGFDRTTATGSANTAQYPEPLRSRYDDIESCPESLLLWFHHVPWDRKMSSGRTLWDEICLHYDRGISEVQDFQDIWAKAKPYVDAKRWSEVAERLTVQEADARRWRDACVQYFATFSGMPVPDDVRQPELTLDELMGRHPLRVVAADGCIHRFFDTSPISPSGKYIAVYRLPYEDQSPKPGETGEVVVKDLQTGEVVFSELSRGWEMQLGANVQWGASDSELFYNDVDTTSWDAYALKVNIFSGEKQRCPGTVFMVSPDGRKLLSYDLKKSRFAQVGYGVIVPDSEVSRNIGPVADDGVYLTDLEAGTCRMIASIKDIYEKSVPSIRIDDPENYEYYCFQVKWNLQGTRLLTTVQWTPLEGGARRRAVITMNPDGSDIRTAITPDQWWKGGHHINWMPDGDHLSMNLNVDGQEGVEIVSVRYDGSEVTQVYPIGSGHPSYNPDGSPYIVTDAYSGEISCGEGMTPIRLINLADQSEHNLAEIKLPPIGNFEYRVDAHPVWDRDGRHVVFNGTQDGRRCVYIADTMLK